MKTACCLLLVTALPQLAFAQSLADDIGGLQGVLDTLYREMLPLCSSLVSVGRGLAGLAATGYIASRVWGHIARAEAIDVYPLLRPFAIGLAVILFPSVIALINGVLTPTVTATGSLVENTHHSIRELLHQREELMKTTDAWQVYIGESGEGDREKWYQYTHPDEGEGSSEGWLQAIGNDIRFAMAKASYSLKASIRQWLSEVLAVLYQAAALCINTLRTFFLLVLAILGPLVFGLSVFDGFGHTLTVWLARYINIFLWLPVANLFGAIIGRVQEKMIEQDLTEIGTSGDTFFSPTDTAYLIFLIIGIIGYFTVPSVANFIVHAGGGGALLHKVNTLTAQTTSMATRTAAGGSTAMVKDAYGDAARVMTSGMASAGAAAGYFRDKLQGGDK